MSLYWRASCRPMGPTGSAGCPRPASLWVAVRGALRVALRPRPGLRRDMPRHRDSPCHCMQHTPSEHVLQAPRRRPGRPGARRDTPRRHDSPRQLCEISPPLPHRSLSVFIGCILLPFSRFFVAAFSPRRPLLLVLGAFRLRHLLKPAVPVPYGRLANLFHMPPIDCG